MPLQQYSSASLVARFSGSVVGLAVVVLLGLRGCTGLVGCLGGLGAALGAAGGLEVALVFGGCGCLGWLWLRSCGAVAGSGVVVLGQEVWKTIWASSPAARHICGL